MKRFGSAAWNGGLLEGKGSVATESRRWKPEKQDTNPEEMLEQLTPPVSRRARTQRINAIGTP